LDVSCNFVGGDDANITINMHPFLFPSFDFSYNLVGDDGAKAIGDLCKMNPTVKRVNLESNNISDVGAEYLSAAVCTFNVELDELMLGSNAIGTKGCIALANALKHGEGSMSLDLSDNKLISRRGYTALLEVDEHLDFVLLKVKRLETGEPQQYERGEFRRGSIFIVCFLSSTFHLFSSHPFLSSHTHYQ
jgi:Ran GTPase-activating protein (RanGAP) involved in mRNA processing and transport